MIRVHRQHAFQREDGIGVFARLKSGKAEKEVVVGIAGALGLERFEQRVGGLGVTLVEQGLGIVGYRIGTHCPCGQQAGHNQGDADSGISILHC